MPGIEKDRGMIKPFDFKTGWMSLWLLAWVLVPCILWAGEAPTATAPEPKPHFVLKAEGERLSLVATNASVKGILHAIGRQMKIPVATKMPDRAVTTSFKGLSVVEALKHLNINAIYFQRTEGEKKRITKIIALRRGKSAKQRRQAEAERRVPKAEPFKFEFDPMQAKRKAKAN